MIFHKVCWQCYKENSTLQRDKQITKITDVYRVRYKCVKEKSRAVQAAELRLIPSRRITLMWGHDPRSVLLLLTPPPDLYSDYIYLSHFLICPQTVMRCTCHIFSTSCIFIHRLYALGLYLMLRCTAERNQISRSQWHNMLSSSSWNTFLTICLVFAQHMLKWTPGEILGFVTFSLLDS